MPDYPVQALASKATGYPLAFVAAKLGIGYGLHQLKNSLTKSTTACFEPALDYIVCKIPRWDLNKFQGVSHNIGSSMKSVGEVMSIGRTFEEVIQKGLRMIGQGMHGFTGNRNFEVSDVEHELEEPTDTRIFAIATALENGMSIEKIHSLTKIDKWFLYKLQNIINIKNELAKFKQLDAIPDNLIREAKVNGFSDFQIVRHTINPLSEKTDEELLKFRKLRIAKGIIPL